VLQFTVAAASSAPVIEPHLAARPILIVRLDQLGDVVLTTAFLKSIRELYPRSKIAVVVAEEWRNVLQYHSSIDEVIGLRISRSGFLGPIITLSRIVLMSGRVLRPRSFEIVVNPRVGQDHYFYGGTLALLSGGAVRIGACIAQSSPRYRRRASRYYTSLLTLSGVAHEIEQSARLLGHLGGRRQSIHQPSIGTSQEDETAAAQLLAAPLAACAWPVVAIAPGSGNSPLKQWPAERFLALIMELRKRESAWILLLGGTQDGPIAEKIFGALDDRVSNLVGRTSIRQCAAILRCCSVLVSNDTGVMHVGSAVGTPSVGIFGSSCSHRFGPAGLESVSVSVELDCGPCANGLHKDRCGTCIYGTRPRCMEMISVEAVARAVESLLAKQQQKSVLRRR